MDKREKGILKALKDRAGWMTATQLAAELGCSVRSVKSSVASLNSSWPNIIVSSHAGFRLGDAAVLVRAEAASYSIIPQTAEERKQYTLRKLLMEERRCNMDVLAAELCISPVTLGNELPLLRSVLQDYDLTLRSRNNMLCIEGSEAAKKKLISRLLYDETKDFFSSMELIDSFFSDLDVHAIRENVTKMLMQQRYYLNNYSMSNLVLHIAITIERNRHGFFADEEEPCNRAVAIPAHIQHTVELLCRELEEKFEVHFSGSDRYTFCVVLFTRCVQEMPQDQGDMIEPPVRGLLMHISDKVKDTFDIDLEDHDFLVRFGLHLKNMLIRYHGGIEMRNPQLRVIKNNYPYIYDVAVFIASEIGKITGVYISEDEIAYIALHVGGLIEQANNERGKIHAVLLYPGYYEDGAALLRRIWRAFQDNLLLENLIATPEEIATVPVCELLITTTPVLSIPQLETVSVLEISNYLNSQDMARLAIRIDELKRKHLQNTMEANLKILFKPELFYYQPPYGTVKEVLLGLGGELESRGYTGPGFCQKLLEREHISSSAIGNIAIPHPLDMSALSTAIAVAIYPKGLRWNENIVNIIFMLAIRSEDRPLFRDIFDFTTGIVMEPNYFRSLMQAKTYDAFLKVLLSSL